jgi:gliding motility-associated-like protein
LYNRFGCDSVVVLDLTVNPIPEIRIIAIEDDFCEQDFVLLQLITNGNSFLWSTGSTDNTVTLTKSGKYSATAFIGDCKRTAHYTVESCPCLVYIPNTFSPNDDGINELLKPVISCFETLKEFKMHVYNRWGNIIFMTSDSSVGWNGKNYRGEDCPEGVYQCVIEYITFQNEHFIKNSSVILLR